MWWNGLRSLRLVPEELEETAEERPVELVVEWGLRVEKLQGKFEVGGWKIGVS